MKDVAMNVSINGLSALNTFSGTAGTLIVVLTAAVVLGLVGVFITIPGFQRWLLRIGNFFVKTFGDFVYGVAGIISIAIIVLPLYYIIKVNISQIKEGNPIFIYWTLGIFGGYLLISGFGMLVKKYMNMVKVAHKKAIRK